MRSEPHSWTQRPSRIGLPMAWPEPDVNCTQIQGLPPAPPSGGCLANVSDWPSASSTTSTTTSADVTCVNLTLLESRILALMPDSRSSPLSVMNGPGLFSQPLGVAEMLTVAIWLKDLVTVAALATVARQADRARAT